MRKIAVFARGLIMSACVLLTMTACSEEELVAPEVDGGADNNTTITTPTDVPMKTIRISAGMAQGEATRTTLAQNREVHWQAGDQFVVSNGFTNRLTIDIDNKNSGLGVTTGTITTQSVQVRYSNIHIIYEGEDIAKALISPQDKLADGQDNQYKIGINYKDNDAYKLPEPGVTIETEPKGSGLFHAIPLIRVSESSSLDISTSKPLKVIIDDPEYRDRDLIQILQNWTPVTSSTSFRNGSNWAKYDVKNYNVTSGINNELTLDDEPGYPYGEFSGKIPADATVDEYTRAVFPTSALQSYIGGVMTIDIPETQEYVENSFDTKANIMIGEVEKTVEDNYDATFKNMMGVLKLSLKGSGNVSSISITDKAGNKLWGTVKIPANEYTNGILTKNISGGSATLTMNCNNVALTDEAKDFYFAVPVGAFDKGFDVAINTTEGGQNYKEEVKTSKNNTITRNGIVEMPEITVENYEIFNIENEYLTQYLNMGPYSKWGNGIGSYFVSYFPLTAIGSYQYTELGQNAPGKDYPMTKNITWEGSNSAQYTVTLTDLTKKKDVFTDRTVTGTSYSFINMIPDHKYSYEVKDGANVVTSGKFITEGRVRMVTVEDTWNFRDLGGWTSTLGGKVQYDLIYRSGSLNGKWQKAITQKSWGRTEVIEYSSADQTNPSNYIFSDKSRQQLIDLGITGELDLRATSGGKDKIHSYAIGKNNTGISNWDFINLTFNDAQSSPLTASTAIDCMAWIINHVLNDKPVVFHCKSGADRTGMLSYLIHSLLGVEEGNLAVDYEMTNFSHEQEDVLGSLEIRGKYTRQNEKGMYKEAFTTFDDNKGKNRQEKAYYYLNRHFGDKAIKSSDLDKFIEKMLGMKKGTYQHPEFAQDNGINIESVK